MVLVTFDVRDSKRLQRVARELGNFGIRVQKSVFECHLDEEELKELQKRLAHLIDVEQDEVRYYQLCQKDVEKIRIDGQGKVSQDYDYMIV
jgi:CRISPR-associated protein Cas2